MSQVKQVRVEQGDTLRTIASRELGTPVRWTELVTLNNLRLPFIVDSYKAPDRQPHTLIWGDYIYIPWETNAQRTPTPISNLGSDVALSGGDFFSDGGDLAVFSGGDNIVQALSNRIKTPQKELVYHPQYGCNVLLALGLEATPFINLMGSAWVQEALKEEPRIQTIQSVKATTQGDTMSVAASVTLMGDNTPIDFNLVLNP